MQGKLHINVALSGGGIRSASFACGALEYMDRECTIDSISSVSGGGYIGSSFIEHGSKQCSARCNVFPLFERNVGYICDLNWVEAMFACQNMNLAQFCTSWLHFLEGIISFACFALLLILFLICSALPVAFIITNGFELANVVLCGANQKDITCVQSAMWIIVAASALASLILYCLSKFSFCKTAYLIGMYIGFSALGFVLQEALIRLGSTASDAGNLSITLLLLVLILVTKSLNNVLLVFVQSWIIHRRLSPSNAFLSLGDETEWKILLTISLALFSLHPIISICKVHCMYWYYRWRLQKSFYSYANQSKYCIVNELRGLLVLVGIILGTFSHVHLEAEGPAFNDLREHPIQYMCNTTVNRWRVKTLKDGQVVNSNSFDIASMAAHPISSSSVQYAPATYFARFAVNSTTPHVVLPDDIESQRIGCVPIGQAMAVSAAAVSSSMGQYTSLKVARWLSACGTEIGSWILWEGGKAHRVRRIVQVIVTWGMIALVVAIIIVSIVFTWMMPPLYRQISVSTLCLLFVVVLLLAPIMDYALKNTSLVGCCNTIPFLRTFRDSNGIIHNHWSIPTDLTLSDGGHVENLGLYILLFQKRCNIVIIDGEEDLRQQLNSMRKCMAFARKNLHCQFANAQFGDADTEIFKFQKSQEQVALLLHVKYEDQNVWHKMWYLKPRGKATRRHLWSFLDFLGFFGKFPHYTTLLQCFTRTLFAEYRQLGQKAALEAFRLGCCSNTSEA